MSPKKIEVIIHKTSGLYFFDFHLAVLHLLVLKMKLWNMDDIICPIALMVSGCQNILLQSELWRNILGIVAEYIGAILQMFVYLLLPHYVAKCILAFSK